MDPPIPQAVLKQAVKNAFTGLFVGTMLSLIFQGYVISLMFSYFRCPAPIWERATICTLFIFGLFLSAINMETMYTVGVLHFMDFNALTKKYWEDPMNCTLTAVVIAVTQTFFAFRLAKLVGNKMIIKLGMCVLIIGALVGHAGQSRVLWVTDRKNMSAFRDAIEPWRYAQFGTTVLIDVIITAGTIWALKKNEQGAAVQQVSLINHITFYGVHAMVLPLLLAIACLILAGALPNSTANLAPMYGACNCSLMVLIQMLLARDRVRVDMKPTVEGFDMDNSKIDSSASGSRATYPSTDDSKFKNAFSASEKHLTAKDDNEQFDDQMHNLQKYPTHNSENTGADSVEAGRFDRHVVEFDDSIGRVHTQEGMRGSDRV